MSDDTPLDIPADYAAFHDDIYGEVVEWMADTDIVDSPEDVQSITVNVTVGDHVTLTNYETRDTIDNVEVDTV